MCKKLLGLILVFVPSLSAFAANEIWISYDSDNTLYAVVEDIPDCNCWDDENTVWEGCDDGSVDDYDIAMTDCDFDLYKADFPTGITDRGTYVVNIYLQAGGTPAITDSLIGSGVIIWDGAIELSEIMLRELAVRHQGGDFTGHVWYVDAGAAGADTGKSPHDAVDTIDGVGGGITLAAAGDRVIVKAGTYTENVVLDKVGLEVIAEIGTVIAPANGDGVTISSNYCRLENFIVLMSGAAAVDDDGIVVSGNFCHVKNNTVYDGQNGFIVSGLRNKLEDNRAIFIAGTGACFQTTSGFNRFVRCNAFGNGNQSRGFYLSGTGADNNNFNDCVSLNNDHTSFLVVTGADGNMLKDCAGDRNAAGNVIVDGGANNIWANFHENSLVATGNTVTKDLEDIYDNASEAYTALGGDTGGLYAQNTTVAAAPAPTAKQFALVAGSTANHAYRGMLITVYVGTSYEVRWITKYTGATRLVTVDRPFSSVPGAGTYALISKVAYAPSVGGW